MGVTGDATARQRDPRHRHACGKIMTGTKRRLTALGDGGCLSCPSRCRPYRSQNGDRDTMNIDKFTDRAKVSCRRELSPSQ
jgi:hypothetical protein